MIDLVTRSGKYRIVQDDDGAVRLYRHGEVWLDYPLAAKMLIELCTELEELRFAAALHPCGCPPAQSPAPPPQKEKQDFSWFKGGVDHGLLKELVESQEEPLQHGHAFVPWMVRVNGKGDPVPVMEHGVPVCECGQPESAHKGKP